MHIATAFKNYFRKREKKTDMLDVSLIFVLTCMFSFMLLHLIRNCGQKLTCASTIIPGLCEN